LPSVPWCANGALLASHCRVAGRGVLFPLWLGGRRFAPEQAFAAVQLLQACGARVVVPSGQHCCGLPHLDSGDKPGASRLAKRTIEELEGVRADYVVTAAASCAVAILHDYAHLLEHEPAWAERARQLAARTTDLLSFVDHVASPPPLAILDGAPLATYHSFCQSTNVLGIGDIGARLLRLAGLPVADLPEGAVCCGFGGAASIDYPEVGRGIVERKLGNVRASGARVLCSDNPGCILHLRGAADAAGDAFDVRHIVELLADRLRRTE
jgi:L-lactate dehydrogenase complex protein LldF